MNTKHLLIATVVAIAGCSIGSLQAAGSGKTPDDRCKGTCDVTVTVTKNGSSCTIKAPLPTDTVYVGSNAGGTIIKWQITNSPGFKFAGQDAIRFVEKKGYGAPPSTLLPNGAGNGTAVTVTDKFENGNGRGTFGYIIKVTDGTLTCELDPWVDNN